MMAGNGDRLSRPNSLALEASPGEKEPLRFDVQLVGAPPEVEQLVNNIKQVAEEFLYHWKTFPIILPPSRFTGTGNRLSDIIIAPSCEDYDAAVHDACGDPQPLTVKQLHQIRERGEFEVPSRYFPGQVQVWRVSAWLQMGRVRSREMLCRQVALAAALVVVVARDRLLRDREFSAIAGAKSLLRGFYRLLDLTIGMPLMEARDLDKKIRDERSRYLVAELICKPEHEQDLSALASWARGALRPPPAPAPPPPPVLCHYTTPQHTQIDLRLYRRDILRKAAPTLQAILERESRGWFLHFRERRAAMLASQKVPMKDIEEEIRESAIREYVSRISAAVLSSDSLAALGGHVPALLADQLRAYVDMDRAQEAVGRKLEAGVAATEARLKAAHPILARSKAWRNEKLNQAAQRLSEELRWSWMEAAASELAAHRLHQQRYFLLRDLAFQREREPLLTKELRAAKTPCKEFEWRTRIWFPQNYIIWRHFRGKRERIPTVVSSRATNIVTPRSDPSQPVFVLQRERICTTNSAAVGYQIQNIAYRTWSWTWNIMYVLIIFVPWWSPLSIRSLINIKPFVPDYELSQVNGTLFPKRSSETPTMWSRLLRLWKYVSKHRTRFETSPETGLLSHSLARQALLLFNVGVIGWLGSLLLLVLFPLVCVLACGVSVAAGITAPAWMPLVCVAAHFTEIAVYDTHHKTNNRWFILFQVLLWHIAILGILQPIAAVLVALVVCPVAALLITVGSAILWCVVVLVQAGIWRVLLSRWSLVPAADSSLCYRVCPPRNAAPPPYLLSSAQALAAICARGELEVLNLWAAETERMIERPLRDYRQFVQGCFGPFSVQIAKTGAYKQLEKECAELTSSLREKVAARKSDLSLTLTDSARANIRMTTEELRRTLQAGAGQLSRTWGAAAHRDDWWAARGLEPGDWHALAANTLGDVFGPDILWCVSAAGGVEAGGAAGAWGALCPRDAPPDVLHTDHCAARFGLWSVPEAACPRVPAPALDAAAFGVRAPPHPPLPPPHAVALLLHNRDSDSPIPLDSEYCGEILKVLEDAPDVDQTRSGEYIERYRGGGSSDGSSEGSSEDAPGTEPADAGHDTQVDLGGANNRVSVCESASCRWSLSGRARADLASPEDVNLDLDRATVGTSV